MRDIKFRARDTQGTWIYSKPMPDMGFWKWVQYDNTTIFNESTGLKDKNGVEIYEGDIVARVDAPKPEPKVVEYSTNFCGYSGIRRSSRYQIEVIGNIYENPELIDDRKD